MKKAIVTFAIGDKYLHHYNEYFRESVEIYCETYDYELIVLTETLDSFRAPTRANGILIQKLLICCQEWSKKYDYIVWLDADIYINDMATDIVSECLDTDKVCGCNQNSQINEKVRLYNQLSRRYEQTGEKWYKDRGIKFECNDVLQSGVIVFQPKKHFKLCQDIYDSTIKNPFYLQHGEDQPFISYEFLKRDMVKFLRWEYNAVWSLHYNFCKTFYIDRLEEDRNKTNIMSKLMFISNFIHYTSLMDVNKIKKAQVEYHNIKRKIN